VTPELEALARRAGACPGWRWMPGMLAHHPNWRAGRVSHVGLTAVRVACRYPSPVGGTEWAVPPLPITDLLPDLNDPATLGCVLALAREAWGRPNLVAYYAPLASGQGWYVGDRFCGDRDYPVVETPGDTEAEALVAALEAAPCEKR